MIRKVTINDSKLLTSLIHKNLTEVNSNDYSEHVINFMKTHYSLENISKLILRQDNFYVFEEQDVVIGCVILDNCEIKCLYVNPTAHKKGIGKILMNFIEELNLCSELSLYASKTAYEFYKKLGFKYISDAKDPDYGPSYFMKKTFVSTL